MGGAFVCLTLFSSLVIACLLGTGTRVRESAVTLSAGRWLSLLVIAYFVAFSLALFPAPCLAYGDEIEPTEVIASIDSFDDLSDIDALEGVEVLGDGEELPDDAQEDTFDVRRIDDGMLFAVKGNDGTVVVKSVVSPDPLSTAAGIVWDQLSKAFTRSQLVYAIENDLAWRWYHADSVKRAKVPLVPSNDSLYTPLNNPTFTGAGGSQVQYDAWYSYNHQFWPLTLPYKLKTIDGGSWSPSSGASITDFQNYAEWYNWFEGIPDAPTQPDDGDYYEFNLEKSYMNSSATTRFLYDGVTYRMDLYSSTEEQALPIDSVWKLRVLKETYDNWVSQLPGTGWEFTTYINSSLGSTAAGKQCRFYFTQGRTITRSTVRKWNKEYPRVDSVVAPKPFYRTKAEVSFTYDGMGTLTIGKKTENQALLEERNLADYDSTNNMGLFVFGDAYIGGNNTNNQPVFPNYPQPTTPQQPNVTINAPTYNTYTTNETTTTTTDLTPILNAIRILNDNTVNGFDNLTESLDTYFDNLHRMLEAWFANFSNWLELIYEELQQVNRYLEAIYFNTSDVYDSPIYPDLDDGNDIDQQTAVNLELLKRKFPTSIPWDLYGILALLEAPPLAPEFTLPVVMTDYTITIDLDDFSPMAAVSRRMSVLLFAVGLLMNTKKLASIDIGANHGN